MKQIPNELLRCPGFISEVMDHCLATAPYPNVSMAFLAAVALQSFLCGRKIRDPSDNRPNLYLLCLANSGAGKDWPRKVNVRIMREIGQSACVVSRFASGAALQESLAREPVLLAQTDEMDEMISQLDSGESRFRDLEEMLMEIFSASNSVFSIRRRAMDGAVPREVLAPSLTILGTAVPAHYYAAMNYRFLTNGLFSRFVTIESDKRPDGQNASTVAVPKRVIVTARKWKDRGDQLLTVPWGKGVKGLVNEIRQDIDGSKYKRAESDGDGVKMTLWSRVVEKLLKFALIQAASKSINPKVTQEDVIWARNLIVSLTETTLESAKNRVSNSVFDGHCLGLLSLIRGHNGQISHSKLLRLSKLDALFLKKVVNTLKERGDLAISLSRTGGRDVTTYSMVMT